MGFQGFSPRLELAKKLARAKTSKSGPISDAEKAHRKQLVKAREEKLVAENLAQRALVESKRA